MEGKQKKQPKSDERLVFDHQLRAAVFERQIIGRAGNPTLKGLSSRAFPKGLSLRPLWNLSALKGEERP
jgi:hypothetical protein